ncbi:type I-E CRISPR-associated protein Cse2/CasB [Jejubacter calystegiae]|uniref:Type I-E CRISPR-associated protein Cse2/CasB n=1 Tax=Jejubacter calystegiae TaxID=2579935 RepID=A0A4P8YIL2_9ENTR|nr:type I-E CRISPR-associated protein Cse2/CasB [Jejubacter calystegiae]QCT18172.1 type I-E CRISPR-associated protein Cse2/CasB [Jejubacter calystegiae]
MRLTGVQKAALCRWHERINSMEGRRERASLRRSGELQEAWLAEGFRSLLLTPAFKEYCGDRHQAWRFNALAVVAAVLAHVRHHDERRPFTAQLGRMAPGESKPRFSELRFMRLQRASSSDDLLRQLRRAVRMLEGTANITDLADGVFCWFKEEDARLRHCVLSQQPGEFIHVRWAMDYYQAGSEDDAQQNSADDSAETNNQ